MNNIKNIAVKELLGFFSSLTALIFFGIFLATTLFIFFWVDTFFARNIADVRPMFEWMPVLLILLVPSLTMRMWSEERKTGTLELLLTSPVSNLELVLGKFLACMGLIIVTLLLTIPIPVTVSLLAGPLDWGPVIGGYIATLFLAAAYVAIGLNVSARTDNQIVSLLFSVLVCSAFFLIGSDGLTMLFGTNIQDYLRLLGSGSRFQSITRGVIDFRDLYYYLSITCVFVSLNVLELEKIRWSGNPSNASHKRWILVTSLCLANFIAGNFWLQQITWARVDLTEGQIYSISPASRKYLTMLKEPLVLRGYFSKKSHPLLQALVPRLKDILKEYAVAGNGKVHVEFIDPLEKPDLEKEANEKYGIKPGVFQSASKYQAALTNSYLDILVKYGDQFEKLGWKDLIEVKARSERDINVDLRNPEYDITSAIKKVLLGYQSTGNIFLGIEQPVKLTAYVSPDDRLPAEVLKLKQQIITTLDKLKNESNGKFSFEFVDPSADNGKLAKKLASDYGLRPMTTGFFNSQIFWFALVLKSGDQEVQIALPQEINASALESNIQAGLKRFSIGFLKTIGIFTPAHPGTIQMPGQEPFRTIYERLGETYNVEMVTLKTGEVPSRVDLLVVIAPESLDEKQLFALDQFLMKGGTIALITAPFDARINESLICKDIKSGLDDWLKNYGISIDKTMVLDKQNFPLPIPTRRVVRGFTVEETQLAPYPYFVDVRPESNNGNTAITAGLGQIIMPWVSPIAIDKDKNKERRVTELLKSSPEAWTSSMTYIEPNYTPEEPLGFSIGKDKGKKLLAAMVEGTFDSYFKDKKSPLASSQDTPTTTTSTAEKSKQEHLSPNIIDKSADSARIIVFASNTFLSDQMLWLASQSLGSRYFQPIELIQNAADWSLQDRDLLSIRGRAHFARTLRPMSEGFELFFEYLNYALAIVGLIIVWFIRKRILEKRRKHFEKLLQKLDTSKQEIVQ
jgi:ABC-2 type transport system permease protein